MPPNPAYKSIRLFQCNEQGFVELCQRKRDRKVIVYKYINNPPYDDDMQEIPTEVEILRRALRGHPRIIHLEDWELPSPFWLNLYFPYCEGGDLLQFTEIRGNPRWEEDFVWHVFIEVAEALAFCHYGYDRSRADPYRPPHNWRRVVHRDIKPNNIFVQTKYHPRKPYPHLVLGDFGVATFDHHTDNAPFTPSWSAPEWPTSTAKSDVWQLGAVIHMLCHGLNPTVAHPRTGYESMTWLQSAESKKPKELPRRYSRELNRNMMSTLVEQVEKRVNSKELLRRLVHDSSKGPGRKKPGNEFKGKI